MGEGTFIMGGGAAGVGWIKLSAISRVPMLNVLGKKLTFGMNQW